MPRRSTYNPGLGLLLLPLLAVFVCSAGALATLVYGYERQGQRLVIEAAKAKAILAQSSDIEVEREAVEWRIGLLQQSRDKTQEQLADKQLELSHVEDHLRRLREQADRLRLAAEELEQQGSATTQKSVDTQAELERLRSAIAAAERDLQRKEHADRERPMTYSVVPYTGPNQTKRRPIYIECRKDAVVIQPEGIVLRDSDFDPPLGPGNPLAASIRAYSEHLARAGFTGETTRSYPMLLVRPDGVEAYYAARAALESWGSEFGYELVGADWTLDFPPPDGRLATNLQQVIAEARRRQQALAVAAPRQYKRPRGGLRASPNGRGFIAEGDYEGDSRYGGRGFAARQGHGTRPGTRSRFDGDDWNSGSGSDRSTVNGNDDPGEGSNGDSTGDSGNEFVADASSGQRGNSLTPSPESQSSDRSGQNSGNSASGESAVGTNDGPQLGRPSGQSGDTQGTSRNSLAGQPGAGGSKDLGPLGSPGQGFQADSKPMAKGAAGGARIGGRPGDASSSSSAAGGAGSDVSSPNDPQSSQTATAQVSKEKRPKNIASRRGRDWGLPDAAAHTTPVTRPVIIRCAPNQLTIVPDDNRSLPQTIPLGERTEDSVDKLVSGVWDHMKGWGLAGRSMYWRPTLVMEVAPGAEARFEELQALLQDSGLAVEQRQRR
jgi:hypothetical protein